VEEALRESEKQLRHLSSQLLTAQETERKRISRELHDELGQALAVLKLKVSFIEGGLLQDQTAIREECKDALQYMDQVIENVRRLSRDLSPSILEDLGLRAALGWLINNIIKNNNAKVTFEMEDIDHLLSQNAQIIIYRILQEALTNVAKHAEAKNISVVIKKAKDRVSFRVEDDGKGFDVVKVARREPMEKGLGLATMEERARMLGGALDLWSQEGKGTRLTFDIPMEKGRIL
jgi:signal transduction histidine kinase